MYKLIVGIDPSFENVGIAIKDLATGKISLFPVKNFQAAVRLFKTLDLSDAVIVLENPGLDSMIFSTKYWLENFLSQIDNGEISVKRMLAFLKWNGSKRSDPSNPEALAYVQYKSNLEMAKRVGKSIASAELLLSIFDAASIPVIQIRPSDRTRARRNGEKVIHKLNVLKGMNMPTKLTGIEFNLLTGYDKISNEHSRDAATMIWDKTEAWCSLQIAKSKKKSELQF